MAYFSYLKQALLLLFLFHHDFRQRAELDVLATAVMIQRAAVLRYLQVDGKCIKKKVYLRWYRILPGSKKTPIIATIILIWGLYIAL